MDGWMDGWVDGWMDGGREGTVTQAMSQFHILKPAFIFGYGPISHFEIGFFSCNFQLST